MNNDILQALSDNYELITPTKNGWKAIHKTTNIDVSINILSSLSFDFIDFKNKEYLISKLVDLPFSIFIYQILYLNNFIIIITEFCETGSLFDFINRAGPQSEDFARQLFVQLLCSLKYFHSEFSSSSNLFNFYNIFLDKYLNIRYPFYLSSEIFHNFDQKNLNPQFLSPELILDQPLTITSEIWSLGVLLFYIVSSILPFTSSNQGQIFCHILHNEPIYPIHFSKNFTDLLEKMLTKDPNQRITLEGIFDHPWIGNIKFDSLNKFNIKTILKNNDYFIDEFDIYNFEENQIDFRISLHKKRIESIKTLRFELIEKSLLSTPLRPSSQGDLLTIFMPKLVPNLNKKIHIQNNNSRRIIPFNRINLESFSRRDSHFPQSRYSNNNIVY